MKPLIQSIAALIAVPLSTIWRGYVLSKLWLWFIVSTFGVAPLGVVQSIGLSLVASFLTHQMDYYQDKEKTTGMRLAISITAAFVSPAIALLAGAIVKAWI